MPSSSLLWFACLSITPATSQFPLPQQIPSSFTSSSSFSSTWGTPSSSTARPFATGLPARATTPATTVTNTPEETQDPPTPTATPTVSQGWFETCSTDAGKLCKAKADDKSDAFGCLLVNFSELSTACKTAFAARIAEERATPEAANHWSVKCADVIKTQCDDTKDKAIAFACLQKLDLKGACAKAIEDRALASLASTVETTSGKPSFTDPYDISSSSSTESPSAAPVPVTAPAMKPSAAPVQTPVPSAQASPVPVTTSDWLSMCSTEMTGKCAFAKSELESFACLQDLKVSALSDSCLKGVMFIRLAKSEGALRTCLLDTPAQLPNDSGVNMAATQPATAHPTPPSFPIEVSSSPAAPAPAPTVEQAEVLCESTAGSFTIEVLRQLSPLGVDRFLQLVRDGHFTGTPLYRVVPNFLVQFGIAENHITQQARYPPIQDDPSLNIPFRKGTVSFAGHGPNSRGLQIFISYADNINLGNSPWEVPLGQVINGMDVVDRFYGKYGDIAPFGVGPDPIKIVQEGYGPLKRDFPSLDYIFQCKVAITNSNRNGGLSFVAENFPSAATLAVLNGDPVVPVPAVATAANNGAEEQTDEEDTYFYSQASEGTGRDTGSQASNNAAAAVVPVRAPVTNADLPATVQAAAKPTLEQESYYYNNYFNSADYDSDYDAYNSQNPGYTYDYSYGYSPTPPPRARAPTAASFSIVPVSTSLASQPSLQQQLQQAGATAGLTRGRR